jgi:hypothetical protein
MTEGLPWLERDRVLAGEAEVIVDADEGGETGAASGAGASAAETPSKPGSPPGG